MEAVKKKDKKAIEAMAKDLAEKGADLINVQVSLDGNGDEELLLPLATEAVQLGGGLPLCLDSRNVKALKKAIPLCSEPPIINYLSADEKNADEILALVRETKSNLIIRALKGTVPATRSKRRTRPMSRTNGSLPTRRWSTSARVRGRSTC
jgi:cobalamin-dependent methionine synthase I